MKTVNIFLLIVGLPFLGLAQKYAPGDFSGIIRIEDNKILDFTYLNNPDGGTVIYYFTALPDAKKYKTDLKIKSLLMQQIRKLEFLPKTVEETQYLKAFCRDCKITKAKVFFRGSKESTPEILYLAFDRFEWKSDVMKGFEELRVMETRFIEEVTINVRK